MTDNLQSIVIQSIIEMLKLSQRRAVDQGALNLVAAIIKAVQRQFKWITRSQNQIQFVNHFLQLHFLNMDQIVNSSKK